MNILSISGRRKTGKTLASSYVCEIDTRFERVAFADILKDIYAKKKGINRADLDNVMEKEKHRKGVIALGDEIRLENPYILADALVNSLDSTKFYVVDDTRRIEEIQVLLKNGAIPYGVYATTNNRKDRGWIYDSAVDEHLSETELGDLSAHTWYCLGGGQWFNTGTRDHLKEQVFKSVRKHFPYKIADLSLINGKVK